MAKKIYAIGVGPGASDLVTVRAARILGQVDVVYAPEAKKSGGSLALSIVEEYIGKGAVIKEHHFPMVSTLAEKEAAWEMVAKEMVEDAKAGKKIAFISLGDSMLYSTWVSILERLPKEMEIEIVPGITSFSFIAAETQRPLAMGTQPLTVIPCTASKEDIDFALAHNTGLVLMKAGTRFAELKGQIEKHGLTEHAVLVTDASLQSEKRYDALKGIDESKKLGYFSTILINKEWK